MDKLYIVCVGKKKYMQNIGWKISQTETAWETVM